jgi:2',3'-cyclic-nucleotide 2'-phosphodiesterase (5'-nucleotidase family)
MLKEFLETSAAYFNAYGQGQPIVDDSVPGYNFDIVSGVNYVIDLMQPVGSRIRQLTWQGRLVQLTDTFTLAINDYRQAGGGGYGMLSRLPVLYEGGDYVRDLLANYIRNAGTLRAEDYFDPSWSIAPAEASAAVRQAYGPPPFDTVAGQRALSDSATTVFTVPDSTRPVAAPPEPAVAQLKFPLTLGDGEHALGRFVADAFRNGARAHFALVMNTSLRANLDAGRVTRSDVAAVLPDNDALVRLEITGAALYEVLEYLLAGAAPLAHIAGIEVWYDPARRPGDRVTRVAFPDGNEVERNRGYTLGLTRSVAGGAAGFATLEQVPLIATGMTSVAAVIGYLQRLSQPVDIPRDTRIHISQ